MMTLEEEIKHCEEVAENQEWMAKNYDDDSMGAKVCLECAKERRQLAGWLRRLKAYEEARKEINGLATVWEEGEGINKCRRILFKHLEEVNADEDSN